MTYNSDVDQASLLAFFKTTNLFLDMATVKQHVVTS